VTTDAGIAQGNYELQWLGLFDNLDLEYELQMWTSRNGWVTLMAGDFTKFEAIRYGSGIWCHRVRATNEMYFSGWSNVACATVAPSISMLTQSFEPTGQQANVSILFMEETIPQITWRGEADSKYHVWKSTNSSGEDAIRVTIEELQDQDRYAFRDISHLEQVPTTNEPIYWLVENSAGANFLHGPFSMSQETFSTLYLPILNQ